MIPIFHDMMDWEQRKNGNFKQVLKHECKSLNPSHDQLQTTETALITDEAILEGFVCLCVCVQVEAELIDKLDSLVSEGKGDENYRELFGLL